MLMSIWRWLFGPPSVEGMLDGVTAGIHRLRDAGEAHAEACNRKNVKAQKLEDEADAHAAEADRAFIIAGRLQALITVDSEDDDDVEINLPTDEDRA